MAPLRCAAKFDQILPSGNHGTYLELLAARGALKLEWLAAALLLAVLPALPRGERLAADRADVLLLAGVYLGVPLQLALGPEYL